MALRSRLTAVAAAVLALLVASALVGAVLVDRPRVTGVDNEFGRVTDDRTEVKTSVTVENPTLLGLGDSVASVEYTLSMNDVQMAHERQEDIAISGGETDLNLSTWIDNDDVPRWWVTHIERGERTTVEVDPTLTVDRLGVAVEADAAAHTETFETDLLAPLQSNQSRSLEAFGRTVLNVQRTDAEWGDPTAEETPLDATMTVQNPLSVPVPLTNLTYVVEMNGVVVGEGEVGRRTLVDPGTTETIRAAMTIDNSRIDDWWVTHLRRNESTRMTVRVEGAVEVAGERVRLPLESLSFSRTVETDVFGSDGRETDGTRNGSTADDADGPSRAPTEWPTDGESFEPLARDRVGARTQSPPTRRRSPPGASPVPRPVAARCSTVPGVR